MTDFEYKDELTQLLRFESSKTEPGKLISLQEYVERMPSKQKQIYYINGMRREIVEASPTWKLLKSEKSKFSILMIR